MRLTRYLRQTDRAARYLILPIMAAWLATATPAHAWQTDSKSTSPAAPPPFEELLENLENGTFMEKEVAAAWLVEYPQHLNEFVAPLSQAFVERDESFRRVANRVFKYLGEQALPALETMYHPEQDATPAENENWRRTCGVIKAIGDPARSQYEPRLLELLDESQDENVRVPAIFALTGFNGGSPAAIEKTRPELQHENFNVSLAACRLIIDTGPAAAVAVPDLRKLFTDGGLSQRTYAAWALGAVGPIDGYDPLPDLEPLLEKFALVERDRALTGIGLLGKHAARVEPKVREMMMARDSNLEARGAYVLWQITGNTSDSVPRLIELAKTADFELSAMEFLKQMGPEAIEATEFLLERTKSPDYSLRVAAIDSLSAINPASEQVVQRFAELGEDASPVVRLAVKLAQKCPSR